MWTYLPTVAYLKGQVQPSIILHPISELSPAKGQNDGVSWVCTLAHYKLACQTIIIQKFGITFTPTRWKIIVRVNACLLYQIFFTGLFFTMKDVLKFWGCEEVVSKYGMYLHICAPNAEGLWTSHSEKKKKYWAISLVGHFERRQQNVCVHEKLLLYFQRSFLRILKY